MHNVTAQTTAGFVCVCVDPDRLLQVWPRVCSGLEIQAVVCW